MQTVGLLLSNIKPKAACVSKIIKENKEKKNKIRSNALHFLNRNAFVTCYIIITQ